MEHGVRDPPPEPDEAEVLDVIDIIAATSPPGRRRSRKRKTRWRVDT
jgi:hypothetical protein